MDKAFCSLIDGTKSSRTTVPIDPCISSVLVQETKRLKTHKTDTYKAAHDAHAQKIEEKGINTPASRCYRDNNYAVIQAVPIWLCKVIEMFRETSDDLKVETMFTKSYGKKILHDDSRTMIKCGVNWWVLWVLISSMVTINMARHGFLMVVCSTMCRVARVVTYIDSKGGPSSSNQSWHEDVSNAMAGVFQHDFGLGVLVSCLGGSVVGIVKQTNGQEVTKEFEKENILYVELKQGEALVLGSGLRHRGMKYSVRDVRLFLAFLVGKSNGASFESTYNVQHFKVKGKGGKKKTKITGMGLATRAARGREACKK